jgi:exosome complex component RRP40
MDAEDLFLPTIAEFIPFEVAIGLNGRVWFNSNDPLLTVALQQAFECMRDASPADLRKHFKAVTTKLQS